jgi:ribosome biogenesis GTPase
MDEEHAVVEKILPRTQILEHPRAANINQVIVVVSLVDPVTDLFLIDKFLVMATAAGLAPVLCVNKIDLVSEKQLAALNDYRRWYQVCTVSALTSTGLDALRVLLKGKSSVLAGPSGVGKTSLLNALSPTFSLRTHDVSHKNKHGVHTTRFVEMLQLNEDTFVLDTPGFSNVALTVEPRDLTGLFPDIQLYAKECRFQGCLHDQEPGCAVKDAVAHGYLAQSRFIAYSTFLSESQDKSRHKYQRQYKKTYRKGTNNKWRS